MTKRQVVGFFTDTDDGKVKPVTKSTRELKRKKVILNPRKPQLPKPSWKRRPIYFMNKGMVHIGLYDKQKGVVDSVPLEAYDPKLMRRTYKGTGHRPNLPGVEKWSSPDLTPSKLAQRQAVAEKITGGTVVELHGGKGNLSEKVWAKKADKLVVVDKNPKYLKEAERKLRGKVDHEAILADNRVWLRKIMDPQQLKKVTVIDLDPFGTPSPTAKLLFKYFPIRRKTYVCLTDGSGIYVAFMKKKKAARKYLKERYGADFEPEGTRDDQVKVLDALMQQQARIHGFKVEPVNVGFGKRQSVYAAYKVTPKKRG